MTGTEAYELGERALLAGFRWQPGCVAVTRDHDVMVFVRSSSAMTGYVPDVRDPGVIGHLWAQLAERVGAHIEIRRSSDGAGWSVGPQQHADDMPGIQSRDLPRALVAALEAVK